MLNSLRSLSDARFADCIFSPQAIFPPIEACRAWFRESAQPVPAAAVAADAEAAENEDDDEDDEPGANSLGFVGAAGFPSHFPSFCIVYFPCCVRTSNTTLAFFNVFAKLVSYVFRCMRIRRNAIVRQSRHLCSGEIARYCSI